MAQMNRMSPVNALVCRDLGKGFAVLFTITTGYKSPAAATDFDKDSPKIFKKLGFQRTSRDYAYSDNTFLLIPMYPECM